VIKRGLLALETEVVNWSKTIARAVLPRSTVETIKTNLAARAQERAARAQAHAEAARKERRRQIVMNYYSPKLALAESWIGANTEESNFYFDLTALNKRHLAHFVAGVTGAPLSNVLAWIAEIEADKDLARHLSNGLRSAYPGIDVKPLPGRRIGWYAIARALKPKVLVETGVDHGVGSCILAAALLRNQAEGAPGRYYGLDILPSAGKLLSGNYALVGQIVYGDSIKTLDAFDRRIDLFINDSDHSRSFEAAEFSAITRLINNNAVVLGDNSHVTDALAEWAEHNGRQFLFFSEKPEAHWYPGAGIGAAFGKAAH
jgi:hypothetical protein